MKRAYLDTSVWIAIAEGIPIYREIIRDNLQKLEDDGWQFCLSDLVVLEVMLKPYRIDHQDLMAKYSKLFSVAVNFSSYDAVFRDALLYAKADCLKAIDATHVAFAVKYQCELFVTTDWDFRSLQSLPLHWIDLSHYV